MTRRKREYKVFERIDMRGGDPEQCWPWVGPLHKGRPYFTVNGKKVLAYRLTYEMFKGEPLGEYLARHKCDNPVCCNPHHIEPGTHQDNMDDMVKRDRHGLPKRVVLEVRTLLQEGNLTHQAIADKFGIARETVTSINTGHRRKKVREQ